MVSTASTPTRGSINGSSPDALTRRNSSLSAVTTAILPRTKEKDVVKAEVVDVNETENGGAASKFHQLSWQRLTICLIVEAIALGDLSIPSVFRTIGLVPGVILVISMGLICIYTSWIVGLTAIAYPEIKHYSDAGRLMYGRIGYEVFGAMFVALLTLTTGSHVLTGTIAWLNITSNPFCSIGFSVISAIILFVVALPKTFSEMAILGYIDFASIIAAVGIVIIATGTEAGNMTGGLSAVDWHAFPPANDKPSFAAAFLSVTNIVFAYSFAAAQFSFMSELRKPKDFVKSIWSLGIIEIIIYTLTGALVYVFVGDGVQSPALLNASRVIQKIAFGVALPVIFISGSINTQCVSRYVYSRMYDGTPHEHIDTRRGVTVWVGLTALVTLAAWIVAEAVPFFNDLLGIIASLFVSGFSYIFPALMWFKLLKRGSWRSTWSNIFFSIVNAFVMLVGAIIFVCGLYACIVDIKDQYTGGDVRLPFSCGPVT